MYWRFKKILFSVSSKDNGSCLLLLRLNSISKYLSRKLLLSCSLQAEIATHANALQCFNDQHKALKVWQLSIETRYNSYTIMFLYYIFLF
jgi:hypothetical protein